MPPKVELTAAIVWATGHYAGFARFERVGDTTASVTLDDGESRWIAAKDDGWIVYGAWPGGGGRKYVMAHKATAQDAFRVACEQPVEV